MKNFFLSTLFCTCFLLIGYAQKSPKFGKIELEEVSMQEYPADTSAHAAFLYDNGYTTLEYDQGKKDFVVVFERHFRIKIFDKSGLDWADFSIPTYEDGSDREKISDFEAITYNLVNGEIQKTEVNKKDLITEKRSDNLTVSKIAMPKVQEGSVIEIKYEVRSPFFWNLRDWQFQYDIPVKYSEYNISYPEWFQYNTRFKGYDLQYVEALELHPEQGTIFFNEINRSGVYSIKSTVSNSRVDYRSMRYGWIVQDMPAFIGEAYISTENNFLVQIDFELSATNFPGSTWQPYTRTWEDISATMMDSENFGNQISNGKTRFLSDDVKTITANLATSNEKIAALYYHIKNKMAWDGNDNKYVSSTLKDSYNKGKGNAADINLNLLGLLLQADILAKPVLLSTKDNGFLNPVFPSLSQFNYVIVAVEMENGQHLLLDATNKDLPIHLLPPRCYNDQGLILKENTTNWVSLIPTEKYVAARSSVLRLNEKMEWEGIMKILYKDYGASAARFEIAKSDNEAAYVTSLESENYGMLIKDFKMENLGSIQEDLILEFHSTFSHQTMDGNDLLYFNPMLTFGREENPFKLKERTYPVDFPYPIHNIYSAQFEIPEGYTVEELPKQTTVTLPENAGMFSYSTKLQGNKIVVISQFKINKNLFLPMEYAALKEFYNIMVDKHAAQVVLRKGN